MAAINRDDFVNECLDQANIWGAWAHYMIAVAQLRSGLDDAKNGDLYGPFGLSQAQWDANRTDPQLTNFKATDIAKWARQCAVFAHWMHEAQVDLVRANGQDPNSEKIYAAQFPGAAVAGLNQALSDTAAWLPGAQAVASAATKLPVQAGT